MPHTPNIPPALQPLPLHGVKRIANAFHVSDRTVRKWHSGGAPIAQLGSAYHTEYSTLLAWLCARQGEGLPDDGGGESTFQTNNHTPVESLPHD